MIDLKEDIVKDSIQIVKNTIEKQILDSFEIKSLPLYCGELKDGFYEILVSYNLNRDLFKRKLKPLYFVGKIRISESDYDKHTKK